MSAGELPVKPALSSGKGDSPAGRKGAVGISLARPESSEAPSRRPVQEVKDMGPLLVVAFIVLMAPLSYLYGVDSRLASDRGSVGSRR